MSIYMMDYSEEEFLNLSGIQHFMFCRRQWALIHIEQQWQENISTVEGDIFHANAHNGLEKEVRGSTIITRGMPIFSRKLGINGICDVVEFKADKKGINIFGAEGKWRPVPVEYKKGKPKEGRYDEFQLLAQAVCLEEMLECKIEKGFLYYGETRHRTEVIFTEDMRCELKNISDEMHKYYREQRTPKVKKSSKCKNCSLSSICMPQLTKYSSVEHYIKKRIEDLSNEGC